MTISVFPSELSGKIRVPGSKSVMQRVVAAALLCEGESVIETPARCADCSAALGAAESLGAAIADEKTRITVKGGLRAPRSPIDCGESGLCMRMFTPVAALLETEVILSGHGSLSRRPLGKVEAPLAALGAVCRTTSGFAPVTVKGPLSGGRAVVDGSSGSQFLTGLLVALPAAPFDSELTVDNLKSKPYIDLTIATLARFGIVIGHRNHEVFEIPGRQRYIPAKIAVEGDWSGAAFPLVAGAVASEKGITVSGLEANSAQADRRIMEALELAGADIGFGEKEITCKRRNLSGFDFDATDCPDLFPPLAVLAAGCDSQSRIHGVNRLAHKESDRAKALTEEFGRLGISVEIGGDVMTVKPGRANSGRVSARGDHRMAMALSLLAHDADGIVTIDGAESVGKSWPEYFTAMESIGMKTRAFSGS